MNLLIIEKQRQPEWDNWKVAAHELGHTAVVIDPTSIDFHTEMGLLIDGTQIGVQFDVLILRSYHRFALVRELSRHFKNHGKPVFGLDAEHPAFNQDKMSDLLDLARAHIPIPQTSSHPRLISTTENHLVSKDNWGYGGDGVRLLESPARSDTDYDPFGTHFQEFLPADSDWRAYVCQGIPLDWLIHRRPADGDFRTNTHQGGHFALIHKDHEPKAASLLNLAGFAANALGRPCAGVDMRFAPDGTPLVLEVNRTPRIRLGDQSLMVSSLFMKAWIFDAQAAQIEQLSAILASGKSTLDAL